MRACWSCCAAPLCSAPTSWHGSATGTATLLLSESWNRWISVIVSLFRIKPKFGTSEGMSAESKDPDDLDRSALRLKFNPLKLLFWSLIYLLLLLLGRIVLAEIAVIGQELMLCKVDDLDLIRVRHFVKFYMLYLLQMVKCLMYMPAGLPG